MNQLSDKPNIIIILADDLGWGDLGCYGATKIPTPRLDRLAQEGTRFEDTHSASSVCTPSRYSLLTGRYCWRSPLKQGVLMGHGPALIEPTRPTIASMLKAAGYRTAAVGKWHLGLGWQQKDGTRWSAFREGDPLEYQLGNPLDTHLEHDADFGDTIDYAAPFSGGPLALGFDQFLGIAGSLNMPPFALLREDRTVGIPSREKSHYLPSQRAGLQTEDWDEQVDLKFTEEAVRFIGEQKRSKNPFFLYFAPSAPHRPQVPPDFLKGVSDAGPRGDSVAFVDWMVGQLLDALQDTGSAENTLVIFTSDNGAPTIFPDDGDTTIHRPNGPWRGQKGDIWDGGHREPFIARWPGHIPAHSIRREPFGLVDLMATISALAEVDLPDEGSPDGADASSIMLGRRGVEERTLIHHSMGGAFSIRRGRWKALFTTGSGGGLSQPAGELMSQSQPIGQLYDVVADPNELVDVWQDHPCVVRDLYQEALRLTEDPANGLPIDVLIG